MGFVLCLPPLIAMAMAVERRRRHDMLAKHIEERISVATMITTDFMTTLNSKFLFSKYIIIMSFLLQAQVVVESVHKRRDDLHV